MRQLKNYRAAATRSATDAPDAHDAHKYDGMSEGELMGELMKNVSAAKNDGTFSAEQLDEFARFVAPSLDEKSRKRLAELIETIKRN